MNPGGSWRSGHAWLDFDGLIIDITGDQFGWAPVIVTRFSRVHEETDAQLHQPLTNDARWWGIYCAPIYAQALRWIAASQLRVGMRS